LTEVDTYVHIDARPRDGYEPSRLIDTVMELLGARNATRDRVGDTVLGNGYTARLAQATQYGGQRVNVMVRVSQRGQGPWIEIASPALYGSLE